MFEFKFADIGEGLEEGKVASVLAQPGSQVKEGQPIFSVETDKVTTDIPAPVSGTLSKIMVSVGQTIHVGQILAYIDQGGGSAGLHSQAAGEAQPPQKEEKGASVVGEVKTSDKVLPLFGNQKK